MGYSIEETSMIIIGDGAVFTTVQDLRSWDNNFYNNVLGYGKYLIELVLTPGTYRNGTLIVTDEGTLYAFGLMEGVYQDMPFVRHEGAYAGFRTEMIRFPDEYWTVAILCNRADAWPTGLGFNVTDIYFHLSG